MTVRYCAAFSAALLLAACSGGSEEPVIGNEPEAPIVEDMDFNDMVPPTAPSETPSPTPTPSDTASPVPLDEQVQDDADATGMTARVDRSGEAEADEAQPAEGQ